MTPEELKYYSHPKMQEKFREAMGEQKDKDRYWCEKCLALEPLALFCSEECDGEPIIVPDLIDSDNPERGLLGMLNDFWNLGMTINDEWVVRTGLFKQSFKGTTPALALLKALAAQWEIEVMP